MMLQVFLAEDAGNDFMHMYWCCDAPSFSSAMISSNCDRSLFKMIFNMILLECLIRLIVLTELQLSFLLECNNN